MASNFRTHSALMVSLIAFALTGCNDSQDSASATTPTSATAGETPVDGSGAAAPASPAAPPAPPAAPVTPPAESPVISGSPPKSVVAGAAYSFTPSTTNPGSGKLVFSIANRPSWTTFDTATGRLSGSPTAANVGTSAQITISASNGPKSAALSPFAISVTQADSSMITLSWTPPVLNTNGTTATDLDGYHIYYGSTAATLTHVVTVGTNVTSYVFNQLTAGTWYFAVATVNLDKVESTLSAIVPVELGS